MASVVHPLELGAKIGVDEIPKALRARREELARANNDPNALRVCTLNLVAFCHDEQKCGETRDVLGAMVSDHPGRLFLIHAHREVETPNLEARVAVDGVPMGPGVPPTYSELIDIEAEGPQVDFLPAVITSLLESDQPACAWWATPPSFGPNWRKMAHVCDRMVVDSSALDPWDLMRLVEFVKSDLPGAGTDDHAALGDLSWARAKPFMALVARFFDQPELREQALGVQRIAVRYAPPAGQATPITAALLGAWVRGRLQKLGKAARVKVAPKVELLKTPRQDLAPGELAEVVLHGSSEQPLELAVVRPEGGGMLVAEARRGLAMPSQRMRLQTGNKSWLLAQELQIYGRDALFESALIDAVEILRESRR